MAATEYTIRRKVFALLGAQFHLYNADGSLLGYCKQKAFKLKEDIRIFTDETMQTEKLKISARSIIDFSAAYDVVDSATGRKVGALQRKGFASMFRDTWLMLDDQDKEIGKVLEDSTILSFVRRFVDFGSLIPQKFHLVAGDKQEIAAYKTHFNLFVHKMTVTVYEECPVDPVLVLASAVLLMAIEGRQT